MRRYLLTLSLLGALLLVGCQSDTVLTGPDVDEGPGSLGGVAVTNSISDVGIEPVVLEGFPDIEAECEARSALPGGVFGPNTDDDNFWPDEDGFNFSVTPDDTFLSWEAVGDNLMRTVFVYTNRTDPVSSNVYEYDGTVTSDANLSAPQELEIIHFTFCYNEPPPPPPGDEGCTPGYWKNHLDAWGGTSYAPDQSLESVFDVPDALGFDDTTLLAALNFGGGPGVEGAAEILFRAAVAALLNASSSDVEYARTEGDVISDVNAALASGDRDTILDLATALDEDNNAVCPLD